MARIHAALESLFMGVLDLQPHNYRFEQEEESCCQNRSKQHPAQDGMTKNVTELDQGLLKIRAKPLKSTVLRDESLRRETTSITVSKSLTEASDGSR